MLVPGATRIENHGFASPPEMQHVLRSPSTQLGARKAPLYVETIAVSSAVTGIILPVGGMGEGGGIGGKGGGLGGGAGGGGGADGFGGGGEG